VAGVIALTIVIGTILGGPALLRRVSSSLSVLGLGQFAYGYEYKAEFKQAAGLRSGAQVRIAGLPLGIVKSVSLGHQRVVATLVLQKDVPLGDETRATIKMASVLGNQYVALIPEGDGALEHGGTIPLSRTAVPYTLSEIATDTTINVGGLDTEAMKHLIGVLSDTMRQTPTVNKLAIDQVSQLVEATAARRDAIRALVANTATAVKMVNLESDGIFDLMSQADIVVQAVYARRELIHQLLVDTQSMANAINEIIRTNQKRINPTLRSLGTVLQTLADNRKLLTELLDSMANAGRYFANVSGTGPYESIYLPQGPTPDQALCVLGLAQGCR
jgi:phospholipid/cholesterol/gamma-HCH transport system substrate-binding protein